MTNAQWRCSQCQTVNGSAIRRCRECRRVRQSDAELLPLPGLSAVEGNSATIVRTYLGKQQADTTAAFQGDAAALAERGYSPITQSWAPGQWGAGAFLVALLLCFVLVGIFIFIYMLVVKPVGTLTVTYARTPSSVSVPTPAASPVVGSLTLSDRLAQLDAARSSGLITEDEYEAKRAEVLRNL